jgi:hypothetical protein
MKDLIPKYDLGFLVFVCFAYFGQYFKKKCFIHLFTYIYIVWVISNPCPPSSLPLPHSFPGRTCSALISTFVEEKILT